MQAGFVLIVSHWPAAYIAAMREALAKLLLIAAVLLMPFGMAMPAAAAEHHLTAAAPSAMQHCPDEGSTDQRHSGSGECTMACASALPAVSPSVDPVLALIAAPSLRVLAEPMTGLHPETATPPPRLA
jgi:hypothetical protein